MTEVTAAAPADEDALQVGLIVRLEHSTATWTVQALFTEAGERCAVLLSTESNRTSTVRVEQIHRVTGIAPDAGSSPVRVPITFTGDAYLQLAAIARTRPLDWQREHVDDLVAAVVGWLVERSLGEAERLAEEQRVRAANARHIAAVVAPWPSGAWQQDEVDEVVHAAKAGHTLEAIAVQVRRQRREVAALLRGFGMTAPRSIRGGQPADRRGRAAG